MASDPSAVVAAAETPRLVAAIRRRADLYDAILALEQAVARPGAGREGEWIATCLDALADLRPEVIEHITCTESSDGLYAEILELAPRLAHRVEILRAEHVEMRAGLDAIIDALHTRPATTETIEHGRSSTLQLLGLLVRHRQRGADLIWDTYNLDIGANE